MLHNFPSMYIYCLNAMQCNRKHEKKHSPNSILCCFCCCWCCRCRVGYHHHCHAFIVVVVQRSRYYYFFPRIFFHCMYGAYGIHTTKGHFYLSYAFSEHRFPSILCLFCVFLLLFFFVRLANGKLPCSWQFVMMMIWWWRTWYEANEDMNSRKWIECVQNNKIQTNRKKSSGMNIK